MRVFLPALLAGVLLSACGGGGGGGTTPAAATTATPTSAPTVAATAAPQVITMALPTTAIGTETDPTYGLIAGYTEAVYSQVLAFVPNAVVMFVNGQPAASAVPHTLDVISATNGSTTFPANPTLATTASGGSALAAGFNSGTINAGTTIGPITLTAGTYFIGCGYHYASNGMKTVLVVGAAATPGPQATPVASNTPVPNNAYGYN